MDRAAARLAQIGAEFDHGFALELGRIEAALGALGRPQDRLPPVIHVAGTNGKGSTCAFCRAIAEAAGLRAHVFTSPHLLRVHERIRLAGALVSDAAFVAALDEVAATGATLTYFEALTAAAFVLFARAPADVLILEVGLGGRYDATNVAAPAVCVITPIGLDHQAFLGETIAEIAWQKAGILKPGAPAVIAPQPVEAEAVIRMEAELLGVELIWAAPFEGAIGLIGAHQRINAGAAAAAMRACGLAVSEAAIAAGVAAAKWPGRLQRLVSGPLAAAIAAKGGEVWVDGAHNEPAAQALAAALADLAPPLPIALVFGALSTKDLRGMLAALASLRPQVLAVPVPASRAGRDPAEIVAAAAALGLEAQAFGSVAEAVAAAPAGARIIIAGSLYLLGEALGA